MSCENEEAYATKRLRMEEDESSEEELSCETSTTCSFFSSTTEDTRAPPEEEPEDPNAWIKTPMIHQRFLLKHPRVILSFLRFLDEYNELAEGEEILMLPAIPQRVVETIFHHPAVRDPPEEYRRKVDELKQRVIAHSDLSELQWQ